MVDDGKEYLHDSHQKATKFAKEREPGVENYYVNMDPSNCDMLVEMGGLNLDIEVVNSITHLLIMLSITLCMNKKP